MIFLPNIDLMKVEAARTFATEVHMGQVRRFSGRPYIEHPEHVARLVWAHSGPLRPDVDLICAAYLHDTLEDTDTSFETIENHFGLGVARLVQAVTHQSKDKHQTMKRLKSNFDERHPVWSVFLADKIANTQDIIASWPDLTKSQRDSTSKQRDWLNHVSDEKSMTLYLLNSMAGQFSFEITRLNLLVRNDELKGVRRASEG